MKRLFMAAATMMLAVGFVGCTKSDEAPIVKDIKVEFSVAGKDGFDTTRAVKTAWTDGDQILVLFKPSGGDWLGTANSKDNTLTLTYSESTGWGATKNNWSETLTNSTNGEFLAVHYRGDIALGEKYQSNKGYYFANYYGGEFLRMENGEYTITSDVMDLGTLALRLRDDAVQFSVQGLASNSDTWEMLVNYDDYIDLNTDGACPVNGYNSGTLTYRTDSGGFVGNQSNQWMSNVVNDGDRSFFGTFDDNEDVTEKYVFVLWNKTKGKKYVFNYAPSSFVPLAEKAAYLLPPLTLEGDGVTLVAGCKWSAL